MNTQLKNPIISTLENYLQSIISPQATILEQSTPPLKQALINMGDRNLLGLRIPESYGGLGCEAADYYYCQMLIARYSGVLAFLQTQHQSAGNQLANSDNNALKEKYLPAMAKGKVLIGLGFSQIRRNGDPVMKAIPVEGGYQLDGEIPWVTGFDYFSEFIIGAILPNKKELYGLVPLKNTTQDLGGKITFSKPIDLVAMKSANTVTAKVEKWFLADDNVVKINPANSIHENDLKNVLHHGFFALGCAQAALDILQVNYEKKQLLFLQETGDYLRQELDNCTQKMLQALSSDNYSFEEKLKLRVAAINLALKASQTAVISSSGAASYIHHSANRIYREALIFSVFGQTTKVMETSLKLLIY